MARSPIDLPRMQNQPRPRVPVARGPNLVPLAGERAAAEAAQAAMMRQYELIDRVKQYNPTTNEDLLNRAYVYAMRAHGEQKRDSGDPYISHPLEVAAILTDLKLDDATIAAALLHDTIEDTDATRAEIDRLFGHEIGRLVEGLTKLKRLDLVSKEAKQAENLRKLLLAIADDVRVLLIKLADRLHNMRTLSHRPPEARRRTAEETLDIYAPLAGRMGMQEMREELEDLAFRELNPEAYKVITERLEALAERSSGWITEIEQQLAKKLGDRGIAAEVSGRRKRAYSIWRKMERKAVGFEQLSDIFGFRVVVGDVAECYQALGIVHTSWPVVPGRFKDYISTPKQNDYRSIHTTVIGPGKQRVELQIRTREMQQIAEYGIAAHALYKDGVGSPTEMLSRESSAYAWLRRTIELLAEGSNPGRVFGAHQARTVPRPGVLLHAEGQADRAAARRNADRFRLCGAYRRRQYGDRRQDQRQDRPAQFAAAERRRGADPDLEGADRAARRLGIDRGHRQGARRHPARDARRRAQPIFRARPAHRRAAVPARQDRLFGREARRRIAAAGARLDRRRDVGRRPRRDESLRRRARHVSRLQGRARHAGCAEGGERLVRPKIRQGGEVQAAGRRRKRRGDPDPRHQYRFAGAALRPRAARFRATASSAS